MLSHLAARHRVHLGCLFDDREDAVHVARLRSLCASVGAFPIDPATARLRTARAWATGEPLSFAKFHEPRLVSWVRETCARQPIDCQVIFSAAMARYAQENPASDTPVIVDFVDVDSEKWAEYAAANRPPLSWLFRRETRLVAGAERRIAERAHACLFVSEGEADLFRRRIGRGARTPVRAMTNGVDLHRFDPTLRYDNPLESGAPAVVFVGRMDYWANVDAASWFVRDILPKLRRCVPDLRFYIVGAAPTRRVRALAEPSRVIVTGRVEDVRPYLAHATVVVAPLRIARGIQNKVLEAMAAGKAVVASPPAFAGIDAVPGRDIAVGADEDDFAAAVARLVEDEEERGRMGRAARARMMARYAWSAQLRLLDDLIDDASRLKRASASGPPPPRMREYG
jgi:sugar transferase (PEP-CTERM/EpsH1 system associated)